MLIIKIYNISYLTYNQPQAKKVRIAGDPIGLYEYISNCKIVNLNIYNSINHSDVFGTHNSNVHKYRVESLSCRAEWAIAHPVLSKIDAPVTKAFNTL